jgi:hypothetical protein
VQVGTRTGGYRTLVGHSFAPVSVPCATTCNKASRGVGSRFRAPIQARCRARLGGRASSRRGLYGLAPGLRPVAPVATGSQAARVVTTLC